MKVADSLIKQHRLAFIDAIRGLAIIFMVEAHVMNSCLDPAYKRGTLFEYVDISNGMVTVAFLFCAGAGFFLAMRNRIDEYQKFGSGFWRYLRRLGFILGVAYWLHIPRHRVDLFLSMPREELMSFLQFDVLHVIVACTFFSLVCVLVLGNMRRVQWLFAVLSVCIFAATPIVWSWNPERVLPLPLAMALMEPPLSKFPLFPWAGYFFAGVVTTGAFAASSHRHRFAIAALVGGVVLSAAAFYMQYAGIAYPGVHDWWLTSPEHSLYRLGMIIALFGGMFLVERWAEGSWPHTLLRRSGQESLGFYVIHLMIVYGSVVNQGINRLWANSLTPVEFIGVTTTVVGIVYGIVFQWQKFRYRSPDRARYTLYVLFSAFMLMFLLWPLFDPL